MAPILTRDAQMTPGNRATWEVWIPILTVCAIICVLISSLRRLLADQAKAERVKEVQQAHRAVRDLQGPREAIISIPESTEMDTLPKPPPAYTARPADGEVELDVRFGGINHPLEDDALTFQRPVEIARPGNR